ncbi:DUF2280 domain-containing protein [Rouxiella badensis]|uniref:Uncharacterized protein n=1 Tax=Rouxiella badensis TaxID=1646377 RepID=A0A1X0WAB7_9GAMM|nr:DUF2280 domain-containing protein [Rouxiella badensis]ORJ23737.1 hypothetical protein BS640_19990 [Rouxiella badensis]WAT05521.1 DUF2280 domain-containing protein [Rouxiella badensis]
MASLKPKVKAITLQLVACIDTAYQVLDAVLKEIDIQITYQIKAVFTRTLATTNTFKWLLHRL